jgi:hypothetical protein
VEELAAELEKDDQLQRRDQMTEETKATIPEIQALYGEHAAGILNRLRDQYEEIATAKLETQGSFFDRLDDAQKKAAIREYRLKLANEARDEAKQQYTEAVREYRERVEQRKTQAEAALYGHGDALSADVLARAALASDEELRNMARIASKTNNASLKQAALSVAADRGMGDALLEVFGDEDRALYQEIQQAPPGEVLDRQTDDDGIDAVVPGVNPSQIMPPAKGSS